MKYTFRQCTFYDFNFLFNLKKENFESYIDKIWGWDDNEQKLLLKKDLYNHLKDKKIILVDSKPVGTYSTRMINNDLLISEINIGKAYQHKGIGSSILKEQLKENEKKGIRTILKVFKDNPARHLYKNLGFTVYEETDIHYKMERIKLKNEEEYLNFAKNIAKKAGEIMLKYFYTDSKSSYKKDDSIVTIADKEINSYLIKQVQKNYPLHSVDGEEEQFGKSDYVWVCDPIDGTAMYARHIPIALFSLALVVKGEPRIGVVYDPFTNNLYTAIKGKGAYRNNEKITVSNCKLSDVQSVCHYDIWKTAGYDINNIVQELRNKSYFVSIGTIARACICVATGDFTLAIFPGTEHKNCDIAAIKVIVEEAGGIVTDLFGKEQRYDKNINGAIISNKKAYNEALNVINKHLIDKHLSENFEKDS